LIISARYDTLFPPEINRQVISKRHDISEEDVEYDKIYEDTVTTSKISVIDNADHLTVLWSSATHREIERWFAESYDLDEEQGSTSYLNILTIIGLLSASSAFFTLVYLMHGKQQDVVKNDLDFKALSRDYFLYSFLFAIPGFVVFSPLFLLPPLNTSIYISILSGSFLGTAYLLRKRTKENETFKDRLKRYLSEPVSEYIYGGIYGISLLLIVKIFVSDRYLNLTLISSRFIYFILTAVILFFFFSIDNMFFFDVLNNNISSTVKRIAVYSSFKSIYVVVIMIIASLLAMASYYMIPYAVGLFVIMGTSSVSIHRYSGSKIIPSVTVSILIASIFVSITALFDPVSMIF